VNEHTLWVRPGILADPNIEQQVVVARLFAESEILVRLRRRENPLEIPAPVILIDRLNENTDVVRRQCV